jgi:acetyltransferase-like isoleucine patch superfamily enzyme/dTDP-4-dehydrorhamnose 3,5-epimerase-like enzyme
MTTIHTSYFAHEKAIVEPGAQIGEHTRVWAFAHVLPGARIGSECNICDQVFIENDVIVGDRVTIKCGVQLWDGLRVETDVFIGPNVTFTNDPFPRSKQYPEKFKVTVIRAGASIGANSTILPGITIGRNAMIGAGSVVTRDVPANAIVFGNPARIQGYVNVTSGDRPRQPVVDSKTSSVKGVSLIKLPTHVDLRGSLTVGEFDKHIPFIPKRIFAVYDVPTGHVRGEHAHHQQHQLLVCIKGSCTVVVDDGQRSEEYILDSPDEGLHIPPMVWATQYKYSKDAVLLVFASDNYDPEDYIRDYDEFVRLTGDA